MNRRDLRSQGALHLALFGPDRASRQIAFDFSAWVLTLWVLTLSDV